MVGLNMPPLQNSLCMGDAIWEKRLVPMAKVQTDESMAEIAILSRKYGRFYHLKVYGIWSLD